MAPIDRPEPDLCRNRRIISTPSELLAAKRTHLDRADDLDEIMKKFVFCIPRAGASKTRLDGSPIDRKAEAFEQDVIELLLEPLEEYFYPFRQAQARLSSFFPDKKLVQFDAGKLQKLSKLLRDLKQGGHRVLIFTQMSKMLDTLEAFLNLNGHTYLRLDGSTGVDKRQRLMDKFNNDEKIFCFILSTRSGGLGINLTGADTVIFYVSVEKDGYFAMVIACTFPVVSLFSSHCLCRTAIGIQLWMRRHRTEPIASVRPETSIFIA
jgi:hypothetical protein